jgi:hypothetical protein
MVQGLSLCTPLMIYGGLLFFPEQIIYFVWSIMDYDIIGKLWTYHNDSTHCYIVGLTYDIIDGLNYDIIARIIDNL